MVEKLISRIGSPAAKEANEANAAPHKLRHLKAWLTRACQNAEDFRKGDLNVQASIRAIIFERFKNESDD